jgi:thiol-disulfide isomerase/thioredoxin
LNSVVVDTDTKEKYLIGLCDLKGLQKGTYGAYFDSQFDLYQPSESYIDKLENKIDDYEITVVMGTWCIDSKREVPRLFKVLSDAGYNLKRVKVIAVNREKQAVVVNIEDLNIERVPTIIVYKDEKEVGRIVEIPKRSMEADLWKIIK